MDEGLATVKMSVLTISRMSLSQRLTQIDSPCPMRVQAVHLEAVLDLRQGLEYGEVAASMQAVAASYQ